MEDLNKYQDTISKLASLKSIVPRPEFRSRFENLLIPALPSKAAKVPLFGYAFRLAIIILAVIAFSSTGIVLAAEQSKPGALLYPIKQVVQDAKIALATNPTTKALLHLEKAQDKVEEMQRAVFNTQSDQFEQNAQDYKENISKAVEETQQIETQKENTAQTINNSLEKHTEVLQQLQTVAPTQAQPGLEKALDASKKGQQQVQEVMQNNPSGNTLPTTILPTNTPQTGQNHVDDSGVSNSQDQNKPTIQLPTQAQNNQSSNNEFGQNKVNDNKKK